MTKHGVEVLSAPLSQQPTLANLLELYAHDFSEFFRLELGANGRFGYLPLSLYWIEPDRHPFLILVSGQLAGLALVKKDKNTWDMAEFFVVRAHRRTGIGTEAAHVVWRMFPGPWKVRVMDSNPAALEFWGRAIAAFLGSPVESERLGERWRQFSFESQRAG